MDIKLKEYLDKHGIKYTEHRHKEVFTVAESTKLKKKIPGLHCKTLFLKDNKGKFYLVGMPAEKRLDVKKLKMHFNVRKLHFASEKELKEEVNLLPGSVSIFGAIYVKYKRVILIIDDEVWKADITGFHPNINTSTLEIKHNELKKFYEGLECEKEIMRLSKTTN